MSLAILLDLMDPDNVLIRKLSEPSNRELFLLIAKIVSSSTGDNVRNIDDLRLSLAKITPNGGRKLVLPASIFDRISDELGLSVLFKTVDPVSIFSRPVVDLMARVSLAARGIPANEGTQVSTGDLAAGVSHLVTTYCTKV